MSGVRRALALATADSHIGLVIHFAAVAAVSRLLTPAEVGVAVIGLSIVTMALALREFVTPDFLIQRRVLADTDVRTIVTVGVGATALIAAVLFASAPFVAEAYRRPELVPYLAVMAAAVVLGSPAPPIGALLRRDMAFATLAVRNVAAALANTGVTVALAWTGHGGMSVAWGYLAGEVVSTGVSLIARPQPALFRPSLAAVREAFAFGSASGTTIVLDRAYEALPNLLLGRFLPAAATAHYSRANMISGLPDRVILSGVFAVALPALAARARAGGDLKPAYLHALGLITAVQWPALVMVALLAHPIVALILGGQWLEIVPLVRILSLASLFWVPLILAPPILVALGQVRDVLRLALVSRPSAAVIVILAAPFGLTALALSQFVAIPLQGWFALRAVRRRIPFGWDELLRAVGRSAAVTLATAAGPAALVLYRGGADFPLLEAILAGLLGAAGWLAGLKLANHPLCGELGVVTARLQVRGLPRRLFRPRVPVERPQ